MPQLTWLGDDDAKRAARRVPYRLLEPVETVGNPDARNWLIQGDNLEALKALLPFYAGRVKCVFIDPPYNTRSAFEHYDDNLEHSQWLSMMYPRLELIRDLLSSDGSVWVTIDDNEGHYLKVLMDEVFGRRNFVATLVWEKADSPRNSAQQVTLRGVLPQAALDAAAESVPKREREEIERQLDRHQARAHAVAAPSQRGEHLSAIPQLCVAVQGDLVLLEPDLLAELARFSLGGLPADLPGFAKEEVKPSYLIDLERGHFKIQQDDSQYALDLDASGEGIQRADVIRELDLRVRRSDVLQPDMIAWLGRLVDGLEARGIEIAYIARHIRYVAEAIATRLKDLEKKARSEAFQRALFGNGKAKLSDHYQFMFDPSVYPARWTFAGRYTFKKHFYPIPGELKPGIRSEETACAIEIDQLDEVRFWVRNLERQPTSFWLPTSSDRFYPDFVVQLSDGRVLVVEYKGAGFLTNEDTKEKRTIGEVWAAASGGKCLFALVTDAQSAGKSMAEQLRASIGTRAR